MTYRDLYNKIKKRLKDAGCDSPEFDACCLIEHFTGISRGIMPVNGSQTADDRVCGTVIAAAEQRASGRPLQYIIGTWDFLSLTLEVGEGVLIPRPDTELLCQTAACMLGGVRHPQVIDLCAGSGCVGLGIASLCKEVSVTAVELSKPAFEYLERNIRRYPELNVTPVCADVINHAGLFERRYNAVVANPPYIPKSDIPLLMREVGHEPVEALDGGDGYRFYRAITEKWLGKIVPGGFCAVEVGLGQSDRVARMFTSAGLQNVGVYCDIAGIPRVVTGSCPDG